jgi:hypothetical protein
LTEAESVNATKFVMDEIPEVIDRLLDFLSLVFWKFSNLSQLLQKFLAVRARFEICLPKYRYIGDEGLVLNDRGVRHVKTAGQGIERNSDPLSFKVGAVSLARHAASISMPHTVYTEQASSRFTTLRRFIRWSPDHETRRQDLVVLCANCHRMVHAKPRWLTLLQLSELLAQRVDG